MSKQNRRHLDGAKLRANLIQKKIAMGGWFWWVRWGLAWERALDLMHNRDERVRLKVEHYPF